MTISGSGRSAARIAALLLMALAPMACDKEEPIDETTANVLPLAPKLNGLWRSVGPGDCVELDFEFTDSGAIARQGSILLMELYRLDDGGLTGSGDWGGPFGERDCGEPNKATFMVQSEGDGLDMSWFCLGNDAVPSVKTRYERGSCPDDRIEPMSTELPMTTELGDGEAPPDDGTADATTSTDDGAGLTTYPGQSGATEPPVADGEREPGRLCEPGETFTQYVAPAEACARCEQSCRQQCEQLGATLLGSCRLCDQSPDGGTCGHCLKVCLNPQDYD